MRYEIRYRAAPAWSVPGTDEHYPDDWAGQILDLRKADTALPSLRHMASKTRPVIVLDLTPEEVEGIRRRDLKITFDGKLTPADVDDRWGRVASIIRGRGTDPAVWETESKAEAEADEAANKATRARYEVDMWSFKQRSLEALAADEPLPDRPVPPELPDVHDEFLEEATRLAKKLPKNEARTGTGLYYTKETPTHLDRTQSGAAIDHSDGTFTISLTAGGLGVADAFKGGYVTNATEGETAAVISHIDDALTLEAHAGITIANWTNTDDLDIYDAWSTVQGAADQLWTDQGAATFTSSQYIRVFAGTYDENVVPNAGLLPSYSSGYELFLEGDPDDDRENIVIAPTAGDYTLYVNCDSIMVRHLTLAGTPGTKMVRSHTSCYQMTVSDVHIEGAKDLLYSYYTLRLVDSYLEQTGTVYGVFGVKGDVHIEGTRIIGPGKATATQHGVYHSGSVGSTVTVKGSTIAGFVFGVNHAAQTYGRTTLLRNVTFYDCTAGTVSISGATVASEATNCIFKDCTNNYRTTVWPEETATTLGPTFVQRNNCYHGYTAFAYGPAAATKTYAEWIALGQVDAAGDLDGTDPLLAAPGSGDFSIPITSPCARRGVGAGVAYDVDGDPLCPYHPDIGAKSTGVTPWELIRASALK